MAFFRKAVLASTMIAAGLASTTGAAFASDDEGGDDSFINAQGTDVLNQVSACELDLDILSIVPIDVEDLNADVPILPKQGDGNAATDVPNADSTCNPESTDGGVDSPDGDVSETEVGTATKGSDD